jgi:hypothetical protein
MTLTTRCIAGLAGLMLSFGALAAPMEVSGVKLDDPIEVHGTKLQLNGAGIRYKAVFKVYVAAMYLPKKAATPEEVYAMPGPKRISITCCATSTPTSWARALPPPSQRTPPKAKCPS